MKNKTLILVFAVVSATFILMIAMLPVFAQEQEEIQMEAKQVEYTLPYPGLLADNPLYQLKEVRDRFWLFFTRDNVKKAELLLLFSDKKIAMTQALSEKGKWEVSSEMAYEAQQDALQLTEALKMSKEQGVAPEGDFILDVKLSNEKHREVLENVMTETPQGSRAPLEEAIKLNEEIKNALSGL